jgi:hypothetical protein
MQRALVANDNARKAVELVTRDPSLVGRALETERRLIADLRHALLRQRLGVAADDPDTIDVAAQVIGRTLTALGESRRRRSPGRHAAPPVAEDAHEALQRIAAAAARDLADTQHVLRRALEADDAFLQDLFGGPTPDARRRA